MIREAFALLKETGNQWLDDKAPTFAASLAYYTVFSLAPTLIIALTVAGVIFGDDAARGALEQQLDGVIGHNAAATVQAAMASAEKSRSGVLATAIGILLLLFAATGVFAELQTALNTIWKVKPMPTSTVRSFLRTRFLSLAVVMGIGFLLVVSLVVSAAVAAITYAMETVFPGWATLTSIFNTLLSLGVITGLFALMFKLLPDLKVEWRDVWLGAAVSSSLFALGKFLISLYLTTSAVESSYGAAGSLAALLVWVYYSSMATLFGAELSQVYARSRGSLKSAAGLAKVAPHEKSPGGHRQLPGPAA